jgi:excisionase family DNA binding protein
MKTYDIHEVAEFLKIDRSTALDLAAIGELPGAKVGRAWVFLESDLVAYLEDKVRYQTMERREESSIQKQQGQNLVEFSFRTNRRRARQPPHLPDVFSESESKTSR